MFSVAPAGAWPVFRRGPTARAGGYHLSPLRGFPMMPWIVKNLWLIPALPMLAAGLSALAPQRCRKFSASLAIGSMIGALCLSLFALRHAIREAHVFEFFSRIGPVDERAFNFSWLQFAAGDAGILKLGWVLDPLTAVMLVMVTFV